ncbi:UDP-glucose--hexose-1-phosphate uridylyltransferase [Flammeovirgaceae bacterium SG7u.111]|nr:UDP-glucose--hexose-1-phosphate uridylyltransferase [Flammeovirgaceae bacterium SG7u.132]WPO35972.1 UDP-glucose--hexose-1-phosphate uridylyltransferase [Flammeovirgaceae bacterium SG7u.111]
MSTFNFEDHPHRRYNPLTGEWLLVSPHRAKRPWQGQTEKNEEEKRPSYDPGDYLGPGNTRVGGHQNPDYKDTFVFTNDFAALMKDVPEGGFEKGLLKASSERGICKVVCFSPRLDITLPEMEVEDIRKVVDLWSEQFEELSKVDYINYVQIFENKGQMMGCSNPHPHGQIWAQKDIPNEPMKESIQQLKYFKEHGRSLLSDYLAQEMEEKVRIIAENDHFVVLSPFWAVWPFETMIISKRHFQNILQMTEEEKDAYAEMLKIITTKYDNIFETSFPYSAGIHQSPTDGEAHEEWHFHMHFYPPLLRSATVKKFMVGYEMLGMPQRDITPETSAERIRSMSDVHYKAGK